VKTKHFKGALLSTLIIVSLIAPAFSIISLLSVGTVSAQVQIYENTIRAKDNAYNVNTPGGLGPWKKYDNDPATPYESRPVLMAVARHYEGKVAAASFIDACRNDKWNYFASEFPYLNYLLDATFKWLSGKSSQPIKVLWYEGPTAPMPTGRVYNTMFTGGTSGTVQCSQLRDNLQNDPHFNYSTNLTYSTDSVITSALLDPYDVVVIPQLEEGDGKWGGDPEGVENSEVTALENYVRNGGGLLMFDGGDANGYNFCYVDEKILKAFDNMGMFQQHDSVQDDVNNDGVNYAPYVVVENTGPGSIGDIYENNNPKKTENLGLYSLSSLAPKFPSQPSLSMQPFGPIFYEGIPGGKLVYELTITNAGLENDNIVLTAGDSAGWTLEFAENRFDNVVPRESRTTELRVTIPTSATFGFIDYLTVQATSMTDGTKYDNQKAEAIANMRVRPVVDDAEVIRNSPTRNIGGYRWLFVSSSNTSFIQYTEPYQDRRAWLKFDLKAIPWPDNKIPPGNWDNDNIQVRLYAYCWGIFGAYGKNVQIYGVDNDNWSEATLVWENQPGLPGAYLDTTKITNTSAWYSWDVTSFVRSQLGKKPGDNYATFYLRAETENLAYPDNFAYEFYSKEEDSENYYLPYLALGYDVDTWTSPDSGKAMLGGTAHFNVKVMNRGSFTDNYLLENIGNTKNWTLTFSSKIENVKPNEIRSVDLGVGIPSGATIGDNDNVTIKVKSEKYPENAKDNDPCIVQASDNKISAIDDSSPMGQVQLENSVWGRASTIWVGRRRYYAGVGFNYGNSTERGLLKFDLRGIPSIDNIVRANLSLYCYRVDNSGADIQVRGAGDNWSGDNMVWLTQPSADNILDSRMVPTENRWYSWDVTKFVQDQYKGDNMASFCLIDIGENMDPLHLAYFESSNYGVENENENVRPYLKILSAAPENEVRVYVNPTWRGGRVNQVENYLITVSNKGTSAKTYDLTIENTQTWSWTLDNASLTVPAGENRTTWLYVTIPNVAVCTLDNIKITAKYTPNPSENDVTRCYAHRGEVDFDLYSLYTLRANFKLRVRDNSGGLVMYFYKYDNTQENDTLPPATVWNITPYYLDNDVMGPILIQHVGGTVGVKKAKLFLVDTAGNVTRKVKGWVTIRDDLWKRLLGIRGIWPGNAPLRDNLWKELLAIRGQWPGAPSIRDPVWIED